MAQAPDKTAPDKTNEQCSFPIYRGTEVDHKVKILAKPEPKYGDAARRRHAAGRITIRAVFCGSGQVLNIKVTEGLSDDVDASAVEAAKEIEFVPAEKDGKKVSQELVLKYFVRL
jgi:TonB family protein